MRLKREFFEMANLITMHRKTKDLTQIQLSNLLGYKNGQFISNVERGLCSVPLTLAAKVCVILEIPINQFIDCYISDIRKNCDSILKQVEVHNAQV